MGTINNIYNNFMHLGLKFFSILISPILLPALYLLALVSRIFSTRYSKQPRLVWGATPIINNVYWARAMKEAGYKSETYTTGYYASINSRCDWDIVIEERFFCIPIPIKYLFAFVESLYRYDIFFLSFDGYFLGHTPLWRFEASLLKVAAKKTVLIPYGADAYVYRRVRSIGLLHGLLMSYPKASKRQNLIAKKFEHWIEKASVVIPASMGPDGFGRWDVIMPSSVCIDTSKWHMSNRNSNADGFSETVVIAHAPNHRGFKGTEFIIDAIKKLQSSGLKVELVLIEKMQNKDVQSILENKADILVEQLIATGCGLNGFEGMASGLPVVCNLEDESYVLPMRRWSYFDECPLVSATPETILNVLQKLVTQPALRRGLGKAGRKYVEKYHGLDSAQYLFEQVIEYVYDRRESLINIYHPLLGEYPNRKAKIIHPLVNNRIVN